MRHQIGKHFDPNDSSSSLAKETEELTHLIAKVDQQIKTVFEIRCKAELEESRKGYEVVTMKGLDSDAEQRLMSAKYGVKSTDKNKKADGAAEESKVKRTVAPEVFDKVFAGYRDLSVSMAVRREQKSEKTEQFKNYQRYFELRPLSDIILKGMGNQS